MTRMVVLALITAGLVMLAAVPAAAGRAWDCHAEYTYSVVHGDTNVQASHEFTVVATECGICPYRLTFYGHTPVNVSVSTEDPSLDWEVATEDGTTVLIINRDAAVSTGDSWSYRVEYVVEDAVSYDEHNIHVSIPQLRPDGIFRSGTITVSTNEEYRLYSHFPAHSIDRTEADGRKLVTWSPATIPTVVQASYAIGHRPWLTFDNVMRGVFILALAAVVVYILTIMRAHDTDKRKRKRKQKGSGSQ